MSIAQTELESYLKTSVSPIINSMVTDIVLSRPKDVVGFCQKWLKDYQARIHSKQNSDSDKDDNIDSLKKRRSLKPRKAISAEVYTPSDKPSQFSQPIFKKSEQSKTRILLRLKDSFIFRGLDDQDTNSLIDSMPELTVQANTVVMRQGDDGCTLYFVDRGQLQGYTTSPNNQPKILKHYLQGDWFGQLALLYSQPRTMSVRSKKPSTLYTLDRNLYSLISRASSAHRRRTIDTALKNMEIFSRLDRDERNQLADLARELCLYNNQWLVRQGEVRACLWIVLRGSLLGKRKEEGVEGQEQETEVAAYGEGQFFGEETIEEGTPQPNSVLAASLSNVLYLEKEAIERVIGPISRIRLRNVVKE